MQRFFLVRILFTLFFIAIATSAGAQRVRIELVDRILVVVNSDVITQFEFNERLRIVQRQLESQNIKVPPREV